MAKKKLRLKKKVKILLIIFLCVIVITLATILGIFIFNKEDKNKESENFINEIKLDIGSSIPNINDFFKSGNVNGKMNIYYNDWLVQSDTLTEAGRYKVDINVDERQYNAVIEVTDGEVPSLKLDDVIVHVGEEYNVSSFIKSCVDNSNKKCIYTFKNPTMGIYTDEGTYDITIVAKDESLNQVEGTAKLTITKDANIKNKVLNNADANDYVEVKLREKSNELTKYGVKVVSKESVYYQVGKDGKENIIRTKITNKYDRTKYKFSAKEMMPDAEKSISQYKDKRELILEYINEYRIDKDLEKLEISDELNIAATMRSMEIGWSGFFNHLRPDNRGFYTISKDLNYNINILGENINKNHNTIKDLMEYWENETSSYENIINEKYKKVGIGIAEINGTYYWTLLFAS